MAKSDDSTQSISEMIESLKNGHLAIDELALSILDRIEKHDEYYNAFVSVFKKQSINRLKQLANSSETSIEDFPLLGIPIAIKDLFDYKGFPTRAGSHATSTAKVKDTASCVQKLESAGALIVGKTQSVEFAFGGWGTNPVMGTPWNPWDIKTHRVPGGSSSGSAVAVASGMAVAALGTDTGGSVRTPASYCGIVGTKTSAGLISKKGVFPLCPTHDTVGTLTRTVFDAAIMLQVISGPDQDDPDTKDAPQLDFISELFLSVNGIQIGVLEDTELSKSTESVLELFNASMDILRADGAKISTHKLPRSLLDYLQDAGRLMSVESYASLREFIETDDSPVSPAVCKRILAGSDTSKDEYSHLLLARKHAQQQFLSGFENYRALIMPTCSSTAIPVIDVDESAVVTPYGRFVNYLDLAAISVPIGLASDGLPVGLQIVVRKYDDALALRIAQTIEKALGTFSPKIL